MRAKKNLRLIGGSRATEAVKRRNLNNARMDKLSSAYESCERDNIGFKNYN